MYLICDIINRTASSIRDALRERISVLVGNRQMLSENNSGPDMVASKAGMQKDGATWRCRRWIDERTQCWGTERIEGPYLDWWLELPLVCWQILSTYGYTTYCLFSYGGTQRFYNITCLDACLCPPIKETDWSCIARRSFRIHFVI